MWSLFLLLGLVLVGVHVSSGIDTSNVITMKQDQIKEKIAEIRSTSGTSSHPQNEITEVDVSVGGQLGVIHEKDSVISQGNHFTEYNLREFKSYADNDWPLDKYFKDLEEYLRKIKKRKGKKFTKLLSDIIVLFSNMKTQEQDSQDSVMTSSHVNMVKELRTIGMDLEIMLESAFNWILKRDWNVRDRETFDELEDINRELFELEKQVTYYIEVIVHDAKLIYKFTKEKDKEKRKSKEIIDLITFFENDMHVKLVPDTMKELLKRMQVIIDRQLHLKILKEKIHKMEQEIKEKQKALKKPRFSMSTLNSQDKLYLETWNKKQQNKKAQIKAKRKLERSKSSFSKKLDKVVEFVKRRRRFQFMAMMSRVVNKVNIKRFNTRRKFAKNKSKRSNILLLKGPKQSMIRNRYNQFKNYIEKRKSKPDK